MSSRLGIAKKLTRLACWMPARLRGQFGDEIEDVLAKHLADAASRGWLLLLLAALRKLLQFPGSTCASVSCAARFHSLGV